MYDHDRVEQHGDRPAQEVPAKDRAHTCSQTYALPTYVEQKRCFARAVLLNRYRDHRDNHIMSKRQISDGV